MTSWRCIPMRTRDKILIGGGIASTALLGLTAVRLLDRHPVGNARVPQPSKAVDLQQYLGRWYEIARYEQRFERGCQGVTADYSLGANGRIDVLNRCRAATDKWSEARGVARIVEGSSNAKLKVSFFRPFYGDYWVLDHADDYSWSIVG
jgi:apolipoprotein D and lipocalin family protein